MCDCKFDCSKCIHFQNQQEANTKVVLLTERVAQLKTELSAAKGEARDFKNRYIDQLNYSYDLEKENSVLRQYLPCDFVTD